MTDKAKAFDEFFGEVGEEKATEASPVQTPPEEKLEENSNLEPSLPPPSHRQVKELEANTDAFESMMKTCRESLLEYPLNLEENYKKLAILSSKPNRPYNDDMNPNELLKELCVIQNRKDEFNELLGDVQANYSNRKRLVDILTTAFNSISQQKTVDKRKSDAIFKTFEFVSELADIERLFIKCKYAQENLESKNKNISRMITCMQMKVTLGEVQTAGSIGVSFAEEGENKEEFLPE
jgi:hypothetical protein